MPRLSKTLRQFNADMDLVNYRLSDIGTSFVHTQEEMRHVEESIQEKLKSSLLTKDEKQNAQLALEIVRDCQTLIGGWPSIGKLAGVFEQAAEPGGKVFPVEEVMQMRSGLVATLASFSSFADSSRHERAEDLDQILSWLGIAGRLPGQTGSAARNLRRNLKNMLTKLPPEKRQAQAKASKTDSRPIRLFLGLQFVLTMYLKWVHRSIEEYSSVADRREPEAKRVLVARRWNPVFLYLRERVPTFIGRIAAEILVRLIDRGFLS